MSLRACTDDDEFADYYDDDAAGADYYADKHADDVFDDADTDIDANPDNNTQLC